jgi:hypothetical protein
MVVQVAQAVAVVAEQPLVTAVQQVRQDKVLQVVMV